MTLLIQLIEFIFISALFINALLFVPQAIKIYQLKSAKDISIVTFVGFLLIQLSIILYGLIRNDYWLAFGYLLSVITCSSVIILALIYRKNDIKSSTEKFNLGELIDQMPGHVYWKTKEGVLLGCNTQNWQDFGLNSLSDFVNKTDYDLFPKEEAENLRQADIKVMSEGKSLIVEENVTQADGQNRLYLSYKIPLRNKNNQVIGILGVSLDITDTRKQELDRLALLENVIALTPGIVYWIDKEGTYLGANDNFIKTAGFSSKDEIVGEQNVKLPWITNNINLAERINVKNQEVITQGKAITTEEPVSMPDGTKTLFLSNKAPIRNSDNEIVGMVNVSIDITDLKKAEEREKELVCLQMEHHQNLLKEHEKFVKLANQVAHDIRSPLSSLLIIVKVCNELPEQNRIALREAAIRIGDIANNLLGSYQKPDQPSSEIDKTESAREILVSATLIEILTEKKYQYHDLPIKFDTDFSKESYFAFINVQLSAFRRMVSNLINNAVDAFEGQPGKQVMLRLLTDDNEVQIIIDDNGKGMPPEIIEKILSNIAVTAGKQDGHGIGLTQVRETLQQNQGNMKISSKLNEGTQIILKFPRIKTPDWIAEDIRLKDNDIIIILDDDASIHGAWDTHFDMILNENPSMEIKHFHFAKDTLEFLENISEQEKERVFLLTDFELLKQEMNGLNMVEKSRIDRSILVTSHYANEKILEQSQKTHTKILPKQLASEITIYVDNHKNEPIAHPHKKIDLILVDDDKRYTQDLKLFLLRHLTVAIYNDPLHFLDNYQEYTKDIKIYLDYHFLESYIKGINIAETLHAEGYTNLYLLSGTQMNTEEVPSYLTVLLKDDIDAIVASLQ